jgi:signal transduction histidine kinase
MMTYHKPTSIIPRHDEERLNKLYRYDILDTPAEEAFDKIAKLAAQIFDTPSAFVSFVDRDRVFFKSNISTLPSNEVDRDDSLCSLAILEEQITVFNDTHQIPDLLESPHVSCEGGIRFYAGAPLKTAEGHQLGTICVVDSVPRQVTEKQLQMLETLSSLVVDELEHRRIARQAIRVQTDLLNITAHDLKNPTINVSLLADLILKQNGNLPLVESLAGKIKLSAEDIMIKLEGLLNLSQLEDGEFELSLEFFRLTELLKAVKNNFDLLAQQKRQSIILACSEDIVVRADRNRLQEIFENLLSNALKYSYPHTEIFISCRREDQQVLIEFRDQGQGLDEADMKKLFTKFARLSSQPTGKERSNRLGLSIVKTLVELHNGKVWASSPGKDKGTTFTVALPLPAAAATEPAAAAK